MRREQNSRSPLQFTWLQFTAKRKPPVPATKKGRRSWKKVSKAVRFRTAGSASTCPKSGFTVASSVRLDVSPYLRSAPPVSFWERPKRSEERRVGKEWRAGGAERVGEKT